ncbi:MAG: glutamate synthase-related protein [Myxococcota bacterium]|nr:glutamate synthase-related protein [Myxococcota bacterium]
MVTYQCNLCTYPHKIQDEKAWEALPDDWTCPVCGSPKKEFSRVDPSPKKPVEEEITTPDIIYGSYQCQLCTFEYDEAREETRFADLADDWTCPVCGSNKASFTLVHQTPGAPKGLDKSADRSADPGDLNLDTYLSEWRRRDDALEQFMGDIHEMAITGASIIEPMRTKEPTARWRDILIKGAQLDRLPLNKYVPVNTQTVIGPRAKRPLVMDAPIYITHMSFGALSKEAKLALSKGSAAVKTAMCSGEGGILSESLASAHRYIFEYVPNKYSVTDAYLQQVDAVEIKIGQSAKPGMGGHLPGGKVTEDIAAARGFPVGRDIFSPAHFPDIRNADELKQTVDWLREKTHGAPIGVKLAAGHIEKDLDVVLQAQPDFITMDGRAGSTAAAPKFVKGATSVPTIFALSRARAYLDKKQANGVTLLITGGFRISADFAKALAMGADAVAIGTAAMMAMGCQQYRICSTGMCPVGIATQDPELRARFKVDKSAKRVENFLKASTEELKDFARLTGNDDVHGLSISDLCTTNTEISAHTRIEHV